MWLRENLNQQHQNTIQPKETQNMTSNQPTTATDYRRLRSFQAATVIYDATYRFCERFLAATAPQADQMLQSARSGRLYIAKGCRSCDSSPKTGLRQLHAARASLEELLLDAEDSLRQRRQKQWPPESPDAAAVRKAWDESPVAVTEPPALADDQRYDACAKWLDHDDPAVRLNAMLYLIHQVNGLLDGRISDLEARLGVDAFGGDLPPPPAPHPAAYTHQAPPPPPPVRTSQPPTGNQSPVCPECGKPMALRTAQKGKAPGRQFWGCTGYPQCKGLQHA